MSIECVDQKRIIVHYAEHENDVACGAAFIGLNSEVKVVPVNRAIIVARNPITGCKDALLAQLTETCAKQPTHVILVGSYWTRETALEQIFEQSYAQFIVVQGEPLSSVLVRMDNVEHLLVSKETIGPCAALVGLAHRLLPGREALLTSVHAGFKDVITLMDSRRFGEHINESGEYLVGLTNHPDLSPGLGLLDGFRLMFTGVFQKDEVRKIGRTVQDAQHKLVKNRAETNSRIGTIKSADTLYTVAITNAPDLTNLSHEALADAHCTDITITTGLRYGKGTTQLTVSLRAQNKSVDVRELAKTMGGGGDSQHVAGAGVEIGFGGIPFMETFEDVGQKS